MASVLLIENEGEWVDLIRRALPEYDVSEARTYEKAIALLGLGVTYDVAVVDLNLLESGGQDLLGGELLKIIKSSYPSTRRIALTGWTPTAVRAVFDEYDVDDLLLKNKMDLAVVRQVVGAAVERTAGDIPDNLKTEKSDLWKGFQTWRDGVLQQFERQEQTLRNDVREADRLGRTAEDSSNGLMALETRRAKLEEECSGLAAMVNGVRSQEDMTRASEEFERLKNVSGTEAGAPGLD
jgi:ActR/RegA family two-component response regulator